MVGGRVSQREALTPDDFPAPSNLRRSNISTGACVIGGTGRPSSLASAFGTGPETAELLKKGVVASPWALRGWRAPLSPP